MFLQNVDIYLQGTHGIRIQNNSIYKFSTCKCCASVKLFLMLLGVQSKCSFTF
jgi:hypothetical protein